MFHFSTILLSVSVAAVGVLGVPAPTYLRRNVTSPAHGIAKLLIGGGFSGSILSADFNGSAFKITANNTIEGTDPSWLLFREGSNQLYAVDENSNNTRLFNFDSAADTFTLVQNAQGSAGVVFLEFNDNETRMLGAAFGGGAIDVWDVSSPNGTLALKKQIPSTDALGPNTARQASPHPHEVLNDPSKRFFVFNDLGTDTISVIDSKDDAFEITNKVKTIPGCGPRHGIFFPQGASVKQATHYVVVCEILSVMSVFKLTYVDDTILFQQTQTISTFGQDFPPVNMTTAAAGEIQLSTNNENVYVSNRLTGNETDSLAHFSANIDSHSGLLTLKFEDTVSSGGLVPRMFSLGIDAFQNFLFSTNQNGTLGLVAFKINSDGSLDPVPAAALPLDVFGAANNGPQFVQQVRT